MAVMHERTHRHRVTAHRHTVVVFMVDGISVPQACSMHCVRSDSRRDIDCLPDLSQNMIILIHAACFAAMLIINVPTSMYRLIHSIADKSNS